MPSGKTVTPKKLARFLAALAETGNVRRSASASTIGLSTLYEHRKANPAFAGSWDQSLDQAMDLALEPEAVRRAIEGVQTPVFYQGKEVATVREYSDTLLIFLLKGGKPEKYKDRLEHTGAGGGPIQIEAMAPDQRKARIVQLLAKHAPKEFSADAGD